MSQQRKGKNARRNRRNGSKVNSEETPFEVAFVPRRWPFFPRINTNLRFQTYRTLLNGAATNSSFRFSPVFAYDVDPTLGSTSVPWFTELQVLYRYYRLLSSKIRVECAQLDGVAGQVYVVPVNYDPGANTATPGLFLATRYAKIASISPKGGYDRAVLQCCASTAQIGGVRWTQQIDAYCGVSTTAPVNQWFWQVGCTCTAAQTSGIACTVWIDLELEFFEFGNPSN